MFHFDPIFESRGWRKYSQNDEDGIRDYIFSILPAGPLGRYCVEVGIGPSWGRTLEQPGLEGNCRLLQEKGGRGLFFDAAAYPAEYGVKQECVDVININPILWKYRVPDTPVLISIEVDGQDFWVWSTLVHRPKILIIEYNANFGPDESKVIPYDSAFQWDGTIYFGASLRALHNLGKSKGYVLVYSNGVNAFFIKRHLAKNAAGFAFEKIYRHRDLLRPDALNRPWVLVPEVAGE